MLEPYAPVAARVFAECARDLEAQLTAAENELLNLRRAAELSGYSERTIANMIADGRIENHGRRGAPRIRRGDLPRKPAARKRVGEYDPDADAAELVAKLRLAG